MKAFPSAYDPQTGASEKGMELRDYFAAMAMQAILSREVDWTPEMEANVSKGAYQIADAMMKERNE